MKLSIKTKDIELEYEDEYADLGKDVKERIENLIKTVYEYQALSTPVGIVKVTTNSKEK